MTRRLTFGLKPPVQHTTVDTLRRVWTLADEGGFDGCWVIDHLAPLGPDRTGDVFEAWTLLAALAQATRRVRLGCLVTDNTHRHPGLLAKMAATVDHLSGGRLDVGLGAGGDAFVDAMLGLPVLPAGERVARLAEACQVLERLWREPVATYAGRYYRLEQAVANPKPLQRPHPPLWIGSSGERRGLRVVAEHADVWTSANPPGEDPAELARLSAVLDRHCAAVGRDPATIRRAVQLRLPMDADEALRAVRAYVGAGFSDLILMLYGVGDSVEGAAEAAVALLPRLRELGSS
jgi:alkanesulfonate monooxygenase SsuD/methylene tetrahydromethanopterin reductase-like flavin-dependent oxidoreductase (luciferase family)